MRKASLAAAAGFALLPLTSRFPIDGEVTASDLLTVLAAIALVVPARRAFFDARAVWFPIAAYALAVAASGLATDVGPTATARVLAPIVYAVAAFGAGHTARQHLGEATTAAAAALLAWAIGATALFYAGTTTTAIGTYGDLPASSAYARVQLGMPHPNLLASWCVVAAGVVVWGNPRWRWPPFAIAVVCALTLSRSTIALAVVAAWLATARRRPAFRYAVTAAAAAAVFALAFAGDVRVDTITSAAKTAIDEPLTGVGPGRLPAVDDDAARTPYRAHLTPLDVAATTGVPSLVALGWLAVALARRANRRDWPLWCAAVGIAVDALGQDVQHFRHVWTLIGLLVWSAARPATSGGA